MVDTSYYLLPFAFHLFLPSICQPVRVSQITVYLPVSAWEMIFRSSLCKLCFHHYAFIAFIIMVFRNTKSKINLLCGGHCSKSFSHMQPHLILTKIQRGDYYYYPYFTDDTTKAQRGWVSAQGHTASERRSLGLHAGSLAAESLLSLPRGEGAYCERSPGWAFWTKNMISAFLFFINMSVSLHLNPVRVAVANIT